MPHSHPLLTQYDIPPVSLRDSLPNPSGELFPLTLIPPGTLLYAIHIPPTPSSPHSYYGLIVRGPLSYCAYIGLPHAVHQAFRSYTHDAFAPLSVHGGLTYASTSAPTSTSISGDFPLPKPFSSFFWIGWDYAHLNDTSIPYFGPDYCPDRIKTLSELSSIMNRYHTHSWTLSEVQSELMDALSQITQLCRTPIGLRQHVAHTCHSLTWHILHSRLGRRLRRLHTRYRITYYRYTVHFQRQLSRFTAHLMAKR